MIIRRIAAALGIFALVLAAWLHGARTAASPERLARRCRGRLHRCVSWNNFQQPRWAAKDKPNIQETVEAGGGTYIDADADLDTVQQLTDVETLIGQGADVLILLAQDTAGVGPALEAASMRAFRSSPMTA